MGGDRTRLYSQVSRACGDGTAERDAKRAVRLIERLLPGVLDWRRHDGGGGKMVVVVEDSGVVVVVVEVQV